jgi:alpha-ketoglutarate-dependent 2,4-dichlorophenoxyacetate dioxygenase
MAGGRKPRYDSYELFDAGNVSLEPPSSSADSALKPLDPSSARAHANRGNGLFHTDSSFNPRRASYSLLRAVQLPPPGTGGDTLFADARTAAEELEGDLRERIERDDLVGAYSMAHSRKLASPDFFADLDPTHWPMFRHRILQRHGPSGRMNLYVGAHLHHIEDLRADIDAGSGSTSGERRGVEIPDSWALVQKLNAHASQDKYVVAVQWRDPGDLIIWDNRAVLHRAGPGTFEGKFIRDLRRTTVHDDSETAWGVNEVGAEFPAFYTPPPVVDVGKDGVSGVVGEGRTVDVR